MRNRLTFLLVTVAIVMAADVTTTRASGICQVRDVTYNGWPCKELTNGRIDVVIAPQLGGRIIQLRLGDVEYLWVNPELAGKVMPNGVIPGAGDKKELAAWANYGGDKLWPAPQGWKGPNEWPGPPDPYEKGGVVDHGTYALEVLRSGPEGVTVRLTGPADKYAGIRFDRTVSLSANSTTVFLDATMVNTSDKPVRWGIWQVTQHGGHARAKDSPILWDKSRIDVQAWAAVNPKSRYPDGYRIMFGAPSNPQFGVFDFGAARVFRLDYKYQVGKVGLDTHAGWVAITHDRAGCFFAQTFFFQRDQEYPDGANVEFWASGPGSIRTGNKEVVLGDDQPVLIESEVLSPFAELQPGKKYTFSSKVHLAHGNGPVTHVNPAYAVLEPFGRDSDGALVGRLAAFRDGVLEVAGTSRVPWRVESGVKAGQEIALSGLVRAAGKGVPKLTPDQARTERISIGFRAEGTPTGGQMPPDKGRRNPDEASKPSSASPRHIKADEFEAKVLKADKPALVDFYADWCGPCRRLAPTIEELAKELAGKAYVFKVNVDEAESLAARYGIQGIPTVIVFNKGKPVQTLVGVKRQQEYLSAVSKVTGAE